MRALTQPFYSVVQRVLPTRLQRGKLQWCAALLLLVSFSASAEPPLQVTVNDTFINVHNGAGRGYPIFHVLERGEIVSLLKMRTDWIKIKTARGLTGWIKRSDILLTLSPDGSVPDFPDSARADYVVDRIELGAAFGDFGGADSFNLNLGYRFTKNLSSEIRFAEHTGAFADSNMLSVAILHQPFPEWRISPFIGIATGTLKTTPSSTLVQTEDRSDKILQASVGAYAHITGRFFVRLEYSNDYLTTSRNSNQEVNEWKFGFSVFF